MAVNVHLVHHTLIDDAWPQIAPLLRKSQRRVANSIGMDDLKHDLEARGQQLWAVKVEDKLKAVILTTILKHPRRSVLRITHIAGSEMKVWMEGALATLVEAAQALGCDAIDAEGRLGWIKHASKCKFKEVSRTYEMEI